MGFDRNQLIESLRNRTQNDVWVSLSFLSICYLFLFKCNILNAELLSDCCLSGHSDVLSDTGQSVPCL